MRQLPYGVMLVSAVFLVMVVAVVAIIAVQPPTDIQGFNDENALGNAAYPGAYNSPNGLRGYLDIGTRTRIAGWSYDVNAPTQPVTIEILVNNEVVDSFPTDQVRQDVNNAFGITGAHGFDIETPQASLGSKILIRAVRASNGDITRIGEVRISGFSCAAACTEDTCTTDGKLKRCVNGCYRATVSCPATQTCNDGECQEDPTTPPMTGTLTATPNPCTVPVGQTQCFSTLSWTSTSNEAHPYVQVWNPSGLNVSCTQSGQPGTLVRQVAVNQPKTFRLYPSTSCAQADADTDNELANVTISAVSGNQGTYDAAFVSVDAPELMITGQHLYPVHVTMRNTGTSDWVGGQVSLDAVNIDGTAWTPSRVFLPAGVTVHPGQSYTFAFSVIVQPGKDMRLFSWKLRSVDLQQQFGQATPTNQENRTWIVTDTPYTGTPTMKNVNVWDYISGDATTKMCLDNHAICQTIYPRGANNALVVRNDTLIVKYFRNSALNTVGVIKDGIAPGADNANVQLRCLTRTSGSCANGPLPSMPLTANLPVLPASAMNRHLITDEGLDVQMKQEFWWNPIDPATCQVAGTAGSITHSGKLFLLDSYDFGGDVGVQHDVLVYEGVGGYPTDAPMAQLNPWGTMRLERYLFVEGKGYYQEDGIEDPDCRDTPSVQTCNAIYSRFTSFTPATWRWIEPTPVPLVEYCPNI